MRRQPGVPRHASISGLRATGTSGVGCSSSTQPRNVGCTQAICYTSRLHIISRRHRDTLPTASGTTTQQAGIEEGVSCMVFGRCHRHSRCLQGEVQEPLIDVGRHLSLSLKQRTASSQAAVIHGWRLSCKLDLHHWELSTTVRSSPPFADSDSRSSMDRTRVRRSCQPRLTAGHARGRGHVGRPAHGTVKGPATAAPHAGSGSWAMARHSKWKWTESSMITTDHPVMRAITSSGRARSHKLKWCV